MSEVVRLNFPDKETADAFVSYFNGQGEQDYWTYGDAGDHPYCNRITYHGPVIDFTERKN